MFEENDEDNLSYALGHESNAILGYHITEMKLILKGYLR